MWVSWSIQHRWDKVTRRSAIFRRPLKKGKSMRALSKTIAFVISFAVVGSAVSAAFAETQWERNHPRRDQVNDRLANQNRRITS